MHDATVTENCDQQGFNVSLGRLIFSDPQRERSNAVVVANHPDPTAGIQAGDLVRLTSLKT